MLVDEAYALVGGLGGDEHDEVYAVTLAQGFVLTHVFAEGEVGDDDGVDAYFGATPEHALYAVAEHGVEVAHEYEGHVGHALAGVGHLVEEAGEGHASAQGYGGAVLYGGAVGHRVGEGYAYLYHVGSLLGKGLDDVGGGVGGGETCGEED